VKERKLVFVVLDGDNKNLTMASILFNYHGARTGHEVIECNTWVEGFNLAKSRGYAHGLFVHSGTVFTDLEEFLRLLDNYPHRGIVGHITDPLNSNNFYLNPQCFFLELAHFEQSDFTVTDYACRKPVRSDQNIHHDYTPFWIKPSDEIGFYQASEFGEGLIAKQLNRNDIIVNWLQHLREHKKYLYNPDLVIEYLKLQQDYKDVAENQLWIFNNEPFTVYSQHTQLVCPASGLYWVFHLIATAVNEIHLVDISKPQIEFAQALWHQWNGINYGEFVYNFMQEQGVKHYNISLDLNAREEKIRLMKRGYFIDTVNYVFEQQCLMHGIENFSDLWPLIKYKTVKFTHGDLVDFVAANLKGKYDLWLSNVFNYKYTLLCHQYKKFELLHKCIAVSNIHKK
jgi:hypothetical protein